MAYINVPQKFEYQDIILTSTKFRLLQHSNNFTFTLRRLTEYTGLFISPSAISELDCATTKRDTAERNISIGRESLQVFFVLGALAYFQVPQLGVVVKKNGVHSE